MCIDPDAAPMLIIVPKHYAYSHKLQLLTCALAGLDRIVSVVGVKLRQDIT